MSGNPSRCMSKKSIKCHQNYSRININISTKPRLRPRALAFPNPRPGQKPTQAKVLAWPGLAFFGLAWPGFWLQAGAGKSLFVIYVFSKHGVPSDVTSDQGSEFVSHFFRSLGTALDMNLHFTSGYHLEGDGQTEQVNQTLEQYLRCYCNFQQDNWSTLLPLAEFAYNNAPKETTGTSPFFANKGYHPDITVHPERDMASACAREFAAHD
jgi:hypothetical protein